MTLDADQLSKAASCLVAVRLGGPKLDALPADCAPQDIEDAYLLQRELAAGLERAGLGAVVGQKIGCTTPVMQQFLGIDTPSAGRVHAANVFAGTASIALGAQHRIGVEVEIAVRLGRDIDDPWFAHAGAGRDGGQRGDAGDRARAGPLCRLPHDADSHARRRRFFQLGRSAWAGIARHPVSMAGRESPARSRSTELAGPAATAR